jgi:hypothetical protein
VTSIPEKLSRLLAAAALVALTGWIDKITDYQFNLLVFYALPIAWLAWSANFAWALLLCIISTVIRVQMEAGVMHFAHAWIAWERAGMRLIILTFISYSFHQFRRDLDSKARKVRELEGILPVCIACNRISDLEGNWTNLDTYLRRHSEARPEPRLCPNCAGVRSR